MNLSRNITTFVLVFQILLAYVFAHNKYSAESNNKKVPTQTEQPIDFRPITLKHLHKPFRMAKLNLLWSKAVIRLSEPKLKSIFGELKLHDKEEITWKHLKADGKDKDGLKEAELRKRLTTIMANYALLDHSEDVHDPKKYHGFKAMNEGSDKYLNKSLFKDKKLNKLWEKAESAGFTLEELSALQEEFNHHQDKIDQYYALLEDVKDGPKPEEHENSINDELDRFNNIVVEESEPSKDALAKVNLLRDTNKEIRDGFDHLNILAAKGPASKEFLEPRVQSLWRVALDSDFAPDELESLRIELRHYENRLLKLRHLQAESALKDETHQKKMELLGEKPNGAILLEDSIRKHSRKVEKMHLQLETKIMRKHIEL